VQAVTNPENQTQPSAPAAQSVLPRVNGWKLALDRAPLFLSVLLLFVLPFITQLNSVDSIGIKAVLARIIVFLILGAWVLRIHLSGQVLGVATTAFWPLLLLSLWSTGTLFFSPFQALGWPALWAALYLPLWYLLLTQTCAEVWRAENLIITFLMAALGTSLWAIGQGLGMNSGPWGEIVKSEFQGRVTAGLGNPDFLAGFLLTAWPLALALLLRATSVWAKALWAFTFVMILSALVLTQSMAGWLGAVAGLLVFAFFFFWRHEEAKKTRFGWIVLALLLALLTALSPLKNRLVDLRSPQNESVQFREQVWKGAFDLIKAHPLTGTGFGTFVAAYPPYRPESLMLHQAQRSYQVDHAHNWVLEWTAEEGWAGLGLLLFFWAGILAQWWKLYSAKAIPKSLGAGAFAVFTGVAVDNFFDMNGSLPSTLIPLLFVAALPVALSSRFAHLPGFPVRAKIWKINKPKIYVWPLSLLAAVLILAQVHSAMLQQISDGVLKRAEDFSRDKQWDQAIPLYTWVTGVERSSDEAFYFRGSSYLDRGALGDASLALADFDAVQTREPDYLLVHLKKAEAFNQLSRISEAHLEMTQAVRLDPVLIFQDPDFKRAQGLTAKREYKEALPLYQKLLFDYPACVPLLLNTANTMVECGQTASAIDLYQKVLIYDPGDSDALSNIASVKSLKH
jgi:O-antigen ligase